MVFCAMAGNNFRYFVNAVSQGSHSKSQMGVVKNTPILSFISTVLILNLCLHFDIKVYIQHQMGKCLVNSAHFIKFGFMT